MGGLVLLIECFDSYISMNDSTIVCSVESKESLTEFRLKEGERSVNGHFHDRNGCGFNDFDIVEAGVILEKLFESFE